MTSSVIVLALRDSHLSQPGVRPVSIGGLPAMSVLREEAESRGYELIQADDWRASGDDRPAHVLWDFASFARLPRWLDTARVRRKVAWTLESPLVAHRGYHRLAAISRSADVVTTFSGAGRLVAPNRPFEALRWPNDRRAPRLDDWSSRRLLTLVNSNKRANASLRDIRWSGLRQTARTLAASALASSYRATNRWSAPDLYRERLRAITELSVHPEFDLHGVGWDQPVTGGDDALARAVERSYRGAIADKEIALASHRFVLVLENTEFDGYVTEKIFDAMLAGAIPVYRGAPDIEQHVPAGTFVDLRRFGDYAEVLRHLAQLRPEDAERYREAAAAFLASPAFDEFMAPHFARRMVDLATGGGTR